MHVGSINGTEWPFTCYIVDAGGVGKGGQRGPVAPQRHGRTSLGKVPMTRFVFLLVLEMGIIDVGNNK